MRQPRTKRVLAYARVSSREQAIGTSLADQQNAIASWARAQGYVVDRFYVEAASAVREKFELRAQMQALMADVREGDLVLCDKLDRWSRDPEFTYRSVREILEKGARFYAVGDQCDPSTRDGDTLLNFRVIFAREEHKRIKERMVGTRRILRDQGFYSEGLPPIGYKRQNVKGAERNVLVIDAEGAEAVRAMFSMSAAGRSIQQIADDLGVDRKTVHNTIRNRIYMGEVRATSGEWIAGKQPAIVDVSMFARANDALVGRRNHGAQNRDGEFVTNGWMLRDVAHCARCGSKMAAAYGGGLRSKPGRHYYYRCRQRCGAPFVRVDLVEANVDGIVLAHLVDLRHEFALEGDAKIARTKPRDLAAELAAYEGRKRRVIDLYEDGAISRDEMRARLTKMLPPVEAATETTVAQRRDLLASVTTIARAWANATPVEKRHLVACFAKKALVEVDKDPIVEWHPAEERLAIIGKNKGGARVNVTGNDTSTKGRDVYAAIRRILRGVRS